MLVVGGLLLAARWPACLPRAPCSSAPRLSRRGRWHACTRGSRGAGRASHVLAAALLFRAGAMECRGSRGGVVAALTAVTGAASRVSVVCVLVRVRATRTSRSRAVYAPCRLPVPQSASVFSLTRLCACVASRATGSGYDTGAVALGRGSRRSGTAARLHHLRLP